MVGRAFPRTSPALSPEPADYGPMGRLVGALREIVNRYRAIARRRWEITLVMSDGIDHPATDQRPEPIVQEGPSPAEIARHLLAKHLSPEQLREIKYKHGFMVTGGKTGVRYLIAQGRISNVYVLDKRGCVIANMCFGPAAQQNGSCRQELPEADVMLAQKIALEDPDLEPQAVRVANIRVSRPRICPELEAIFETRRMDAR